MLRSDDKINHDGSDLFVKEYSVCIITDLQTVDEAKQQFEKRLDLNLVEFVLVK